MHWFLSQDLVKMQSICSLDLQSPEVPVPSARYWYGQRGRQVMDILTEIHLDIYLGSFDFSSNLANVGVFVVVVVLLFLIFWYFFRMSTIQFCYKIPHQHK